MQPQGLPASWGAGHFLQRRAHICGVHLVATTEHVQPGLEQSAPVGHPALLVGEVVAQDSQIVQGQFSQQRRHLLERCHAGTIGPITGQPDHSIVWLHPTGVLRPGGVARADAQRWPESRRPGRVPWGGGTTSPVALVRRARAVDRILQQVYPDAHCELDFRDAYELLVATILSAQCTDERVNQVTPTLFERYPDPVALAAADRADLEQIIRSTGFFRNKAASLQAMAARVCEKYHGQIRGPCRR